MYGLAHMCIRLAVSRAWGIPLDEVRIDRYAQLLNRDECEDNGAAASMEYFRICDRITRGKKP
jgi:hypothetical protein